MVSTCNIDLLCKIDAVHIYLLEPPKENNREQNPLLQLLFYYLLHCQPKGRTAYVNVCCPDSVNIKWTDVY